MPVLEVAINAAKAKAGARVFRQSAEEVKKSALQIDGSVQKLDQTMNVFSNTLKGVAGAFALVISGRTFIQIARAGITTVSQFSKEMAILEGVTRATAFEMDALNDKARELGANTIFTAPEAAQGLVFLSRAGFDANQAIGAIDATLNTAASAMIDLGTAADIVANTMNQYSIAAEHAERVSNVLVGTTNSTNTNIVQLGQALEYVGPVSAALGQDLEETSAVLGTLADRGVKASIAGTNFRGIMAQLAGPLERQNKGLKELGITYEEIDPTINKVADIFERLRAAGLGAEEAVQLFGRRNFNAALVLAANTDQLRELEEQYRALENTAQENADLINDSLFGALRRLRSAVADSALELGERGLEGAMTNLVTTTADTIKILFNIEDEASRTNETALALANTIEFTVSTLSAFVGLKVAVWLFNTGKAALTAAAAMGSLRAAVTGLFAAIGPGGWLILGLGTAVFAFQEMIDSARDARRRMKEFNEELANLQLPTTDLSGFGDQFEQIFVRLQRARDTFNLESEVQQIKVLGTTLEELRSQIITENDLDPADLGNSLTNNLATVDVATLREAFTDVGTEALDAYLDVFSQTDVADQLNDIILPTDIDVDSWYANVVRAFERQRQRTAQRVAAGTFTGGETREPDIEFFQDRFNLDPDDFAIAVLPDLDSVVQRAEDVLRIPVLDAIRLVEEASATAGENLDDLQVRLEELRSQENARSSDEIAQSLIADLRAETELLGKSREEQERIILVRDARAQAEKEGVEVTAESIRQLEFELGLFQLVRFAIEADTLAKEEAAEAEEDLLRARETATDSLDSYARNLRDEIALMQESGLAREELAAKQRINNTLGDIEIDNKAQVVDQILELVRAKYELVQAEEAEAEAKRKAAKAAREAEREREREERRIQRARESLDEARDSIERQLSVVFESSEAQQIAAKTAEFYSDALIAYGGDVIAATQATDQYRRSLEQLAAAEELQQLAEDIGDAFGETFEDIIFGTESVQDALESLVRNVYQLLFRQLVTQQIASFFTGLFGSLFAGAITPGAGAGANPGDPGFVGPIQAMGGVWSGGNQVQRYALGGVVGNATLFGHAGGMGLMGEAGPEAIMPLARNGRGELGVKTSGGNEGTVVHQVINIRTPNAQSFAASKGQVFSDLRKSIRGGAG